MLLSARGIWNAMHRPNWISLSKEAKSAFVPTNINTRSSAGSTELTNHGWERFGTGNVANCGKEVYLGFSANLVMRYQRY